MGILAIVLCLGLVWGSAPAGATIASVFGGVEHPITCVVQGGEHAGQRWCSGKPSRVPSWDGTPIDVSVA
ncbi:MAG TPA: hypothetical protein VGG08_01460, partial [Solirubrobacteraceae bacterium]